MPRGMPHIGDGTKMPTMCTPGYVQHVKSAGVGTIALIAQKGASAKRRWRPAATGI